MATDTAPERFAASHTPNPETGCWDWHRHVGSSGYGKLSVNNKTVYAHRYAYELHNGPISAGLTIDHLCRNKRCVNPEHLEPVPLLVNIWRAGNGGPHNTCAKGHPKTPDNVWKQKGNGWKCKECHRATARASHQRKVQSN